MGSSLNVSLSLTSSQYHVVVFVKELNTKQHQTLLLIVHYELSDNVTSYLCLLNTVVDGSVVPLDWRFIAISEDRLNSIRFPKAAFERYYIVFIVGRFLIIEVGKAVRPRHTFYSLRKS